MMRFIRIPLFFLILIGLNVGHGSQLEDNSAIPGKKSFSEGGAGIAEDNQFEAVIKDPTGHGSCVILKFFNGRCIIYDAGNSPTHGLDVNPIAQEIRAHFTRFDREKRILDIIVSHPNADAFNGIEDIYRNIVGIDGGFRLGNIILGGERENYTRFSKLPERNFIDFIENELNLVNGLNRLLFMGVNQGLTPIRRSVHIDIHALQYGNNTLRQRDVVNILNYGAETTVLSNFNYYNLIVKIDVSSNRDQMSLLLPGGMQDGTKGEIHLNRLLKLAKKENFRFKSDIAVAPHHGGKDSIDQKIGWNQSIGPKAIIYSVDHAMFFDHPLPISVTRSDDTGSLFVFTNQHHMDRFAAPIEKAIFSTRANGDVRCILKKECDRVGMRETLENQINAINRPVPERGTFSKNIVVERY